jgi:hypothetical protein
MVELVIVSLPIGWVHQLPAWTLGTGWPMVVAVSKAGPECAPDLPLESL